MPRGHCFTEAQIAQIAHDINMDLDLHPVYHQIDEHIMRYVKAAGIDTIMDLVSKEEGQMLKYKNFGRKSLSELIEKLDEMQLSFGMEVDKYFLETGG